MTKNKSTKRALLTSSLALLLCLAMLVGSTFAWFTDTVTSGKNRIVAGNLDVELKYKNAANPEWTDVVTESTTDPKFFVDKNGDDILWEPGVMAVTQFKVANVGSLALKYSLETIKADFNAMGGHDLSEVIKFAVIDNDAYATATTREDILALNPTFDDFTSFKGEGNLLPADKAADGATEETFTVVAYWEPNVVDDNLYNVNNDQKTDDDKDQLYINIEIRLVAMQYTYEEDSFDNNYDIAADPDYDPYAEADAEALANGNAYRNADGTYGTIRSSDESSFLLNLASNGREATLIKDIGATENTTSTTSANYSGKQSILDLHGHTYTFGGLRMQPTVGTVADGADLVIKDGTMVGSTTGNDLLTSYNAMQNVTLDHVTLKWNDSRLWNENTTNYYGLNLATNTNGAVFTVTDSTLDCNASFYTTVTNSDLEQRAIANITNTTVNGRLHGAGLTMNVDGCTVNGEVYSNSGNSSKTTINISNSTINGNAFFDGYKYGQKSDVAITSTVINGNLQTKSTRDNVHITLTDVTITGTLAYDNASYKVSKTLVTIVSGTYGFDPTNYLAEGSTAAQNASGMWVVTAG